MQNEELWNYECSDLYSNNKAVVTLEDMFQCYNVSAHLCVLVRDAAIWWMQKCYIFPGTSLNPEMRVFLLFSLFVCFFFNHVVNEHQWRCLRLSAVSGVGLRGPAELALYWYALYVCLCRGGVGRVFHFPPPFSNCVHPWKRKKQKHKRWRHFMTAAVKLIYPMEWGRWRNNNVSSGASLPLVLLELTPRKEVVLLMEEFAISTHVVYTINYVKWAGEESWALPECIHFRCHALFCRFFRSADHWRKD